VTTLGSGPGIPIDPHRRLYTMGARAVPACRREARLTARESSEDRVISLSSLPATSQQSHLVLAVTVLLLVAFGVAAPLANVPLPRFDAFIPSVGAIIFVNDLITSVLLFAQFAIVPSRAVLVLASGYLFTALIVIPHALTFPGAFAPTGLLGAGLQSSVWLYFFWHIGFPTAVLAYACLKDRVTTTTPASTASPIFWSVATVITLVFVLTWLATGEDRLLPRLFADNTRHIQTALDVAFASILLVATIALAMLWLRRNSVLDYWLMLVICALISEQILVAILSGERFSVGFYAGRAFSLVTSIAVLGVLLAETTRLYARLARSNMLLERERDDKLMNVEAITASIAHEVRQPLAAIATNGNAAVRFLGNSPPNLDDARASLTAIIRDAHRASEVFDGIRALFRKVDQRRQPIDLNEITLEVLQSLRGELKQHGVMTRTQLTPELPLIDGDKSQLQQVVFNLVRNALEAMDTATERSRMLGVKTQLHDSDAVVVAVDDSGPGIDPKRLDGIFDPFVTTKSHGMGLGLAICRMIIERHGGRLYASSDGTNGAQFRFVLPIASMHAITS
jgi:signal transduction histidine kinase